LPLAPPESFFVFAVGNCEEWPENREEQGDTAIYKEYLDFGVPNDQCVYLKDDECTQQNCQARLESFLQNIVIVSNNNEIPTTLVFYYGGHGVARGFSTIGGTWAHQQIVQTIEKYFKGDRVLFLLDCCSAGSLWRHLDGAKQYALLGTSPPYLESSSYVEGPAGDEWIISNTWIQLMRRFRKDGDFLGLDNIISIMADRHILELGEMFFAYLSTTTSQNWSWMPAWSGKPEIVTPTALFSWLRETTESTDLPKAAKISSVFDCRVGDALVYKHLGGHPVSLTSTKILPFSVPPLWLNGTIVSISENQKNGEISDENNVYNIVLRIRVWYPSQKEPWEVEMSHSSPRLINHFHVAQNWMLPRSFLETQVVLAQKYRQYLDCSLAANTLVKVALMKEDKIRHGKILDWKDFDWKRLLLSCTGNSPATTDYDDFYWNELPVTIKTVAKTLGYTRSSWNKDTGIPADSMDWDHLSTAQKDAASVLGYKPPKSANSKDSDGLDPKNSRKSFGKDSSETILLSGPHVPVEWENTQESSLVLLKQIVFASVCGSDGTKNTVGDAITRPNTSSTPGTQDDKNRDYDLQLQCLIQGLQSSGKSIRNAEHILGTTELSAFWVGNERWYDAAPINIEYHDNTVSWACGKNKELSLDLLATHFEYTMPGIYCPIEYEDGERHLIPLNYIFRRGCQPQQMDVGESDSDSDSNGNTEMTLARAVCRCCACWKAKE